jgi:uncharacterized membrane protein YbhN (UPF0104 family)
VTFVRRLLAMRWLRVGFGIAIFVFLVLAIVDQWSRIGPRLGQISSLTFVVGMVSVLGGQLAIMLSWRAILADLGSPLPVTAAARVFFAAQLGKYVPGSIWPVVMQMELGAELDVPRANSAAAALVQIGLTVATGALCGLAALPVALSNATSTLLWLPAVVVFLIALHPRIANPALSLTFRILRRPLEQPLTWHGLFTASLWQMAGWGLFSVPVILLTRDLGGSGARVVAIGVGAFALSWVAGFLFIFAPAGAGVREGVMTAILSTVIAPSAALTVALISRLMMTFGDVLVGSAALAAIARRRFTNRAVQGAPATQDD